MVARGVLVTGGMGGIGRAIARSFATERAQVLLVDTRPDQDCFCAELEAAGATKALSIVADVSDDVAVERSVDLAIESFGRLDVIVNVAGMMVYQPLANLTATDWRRLLDVNLVGAALYVGQALRRMDAGGCVVNVASVHARRTSAMVAPYAAAKAAMVSLTRSAAIEGKSLGIRVNAVLPGAIDTQMLRDSPNIRSGAEVLEPADIGSPDDVAAAVAYLASEGARFVTGEDLVVDGGRMGRL